MNADAASVGGLFHIWPYRTRSQSEPRNLLLGEGSPRASIVFANETRIAQDCLFRLMGIPRSNREEPEVRLAFRNQADFDEPAVVREFLSIPGGGVGTDRVRATSRYCVTSAIHLETSSGCQREFSVRPFGSKLQICERAHAKARQQHLILGVGHRVADVLVQEVVA